MIASLVLFVCILLIRRFYNGNCCNIEWEIPIVPLVYKREIEYDTII